MTAPLSDTTQGLQWISEELAASLREARVALERFVDAPEQPEPLALVVAELKKVHGALRMVESSGAALLAEEMVHVAVSLAEGAIADAREGLEALSRAMIQMPGYLERLQNGGRDIPLVLLPLLNDLRAVRGSPLLSENTLFLLNLDSGRAAAAAPSPSGADVRAIAAQLRPRYQTALLGWLRSDHADSNLATMGAVVANVQDAASTDLVHQVFWISGAVIEALREDGLDDSVAIKRLLGQTDRALKQLIDGGEPSFEDQSPSQLINNLLYYVARANSQGERVSDVKSAFSLAEILPGAVQLQAARDDLAGPGAKLMETVAAAISQDLALVKDVLDIHVRTGADPIQDLQDQDATLKRIADTLAMLGLGDLRSLVMAEKQRFAEWTSNNSAPNDDQLIASASVLLSIEDSLRNELVEIINAEPSTEDLDDDATDDSQSIQEGEFKAVVKAVIRECLVNLSRVKESISQFVAGTTQALDSTPSLLRGINAGLLMLGKSRAVDTIDRIANYLRGELRGQDAETASETDLDRLADALVSVEYYLETLQSGRADPWYMLDNANLCMEVIAPIAQGIEAAEQVDVPTVPAIAALPEFGPEIPDKTPPEEAPIPQSQLQPGPEHEAAPVSEEPTEVQRQLPADASPALGNLQSIDPDLLETFIEEAREEIATLHQLVPGLSDQSDEQKLIRVRRSFHTLKGSGRMVGAKRIGDLSFSIENLLNKILNGTVAASTETQQVVQQATQGLSGLLEQLEVGTDPEFDVAALIVSADACAGIQPEPADSRPRPSMDPVLYEIFRNETDVHLQTVESFVAEAAQLGEPARLSEEVQRAWHTLSGSANMAGATAVAAIADPVHQYVRELMDEGGRLDGDAMGVFAAATTAMRDIVTAIGAGEAATADPDLLHRIAALTASTEEEVPEALSDDSSSGIFDAEDANEEIAAIFGDEAGELLEAADLSLQRVGQQSGDRAAFGELQRHLHTIKGGARMAGVPEIGDLSHELESLLISTDSGVADQRVVELVQESIDRMHTMAEALRSRRPLVAADDLIERVAALARPQMASDDDESVFEPADSGSVDDLTEFVDPVHPLEPELPPPPIPAIPVAFETPATPATAPRELFAEDSEERQEFARVSADLLDDLLNNVGEVSIYHSRLEQQINTIGFNSAELARTVVRLREQLRKLEMETEAQILYRHQTEPDRRPEFDPLEMDRYSTIQQLSRALAESVSDLSSIQGLLEELTRDAETLLVQQSRVTTELQDGLMRTRMVPFERHLPRFSRLVRQTATEVGKRAELVVEGGGELDRQVLERMLAPFEHMLRNAVVHGIESPQQRQVESKPESGTITVRLAREGSEMVIAIADDGAGLDIEAIKAKARSRGLIAPEAKLSESEALQLILEPGFSTAKELTQSAGRGVGMDVVANVVKQLGGSLNIKTVSGQGATFTVRLPLTLAISQALLVRTGEEVYAIPVMSLAGVARLPVEQLQELIADDSTPFDYGGQTYQFQYLGHLLGTHGTDLDAMAGSVPLVLVRAGEHSTALIADEIVGSREIVVKPVGPQVAAVRGVVGATILGDGSIVIILDVNALVRNPAPRVAELEAAPKRKDERPLVLVVDDSITVRRVTQRLLERNEMRVATAKDGVDAVSTMQEVIPDLILLDIEMPRMDGYEVATHVRNSPRLQKVPIVMVTSRVGDKHRNRAMELGVDAYLGKPYQEAALLETIRPLLEQRRAAMVQP